MIMGAADEVVSEAGHWIEKELHGGIKKSGQVSLFETAIRVLGGLLSGGEQAASSIYSTFPGTIYIGYLSLSFFIFLNRLGWRY